MINNHQEHKKILKFLIVGGINTAITYLIYIVCRWADLSPVTSNTLGYIGGVINSYIWNRNWVFRSHSPKVFRQIGLFLTGFLICFGIQMLIFNLLLTHTHINEYIIQLISMAVYTSLNYLINRKITFRK